MNLLHTPAAQATGTSGRIRVLVVEDQRTVREGLAFLLNRSARLECIGACATGEEAIRLASELRPDVVLLDIQLAGPMNGLDCLNHICPALGSTRVLMLTQSENVTNLVEAFRRGAVGYVTKGGSMEKLHELILDAAAGGGAMSPDVAAKLLEIFRAPAPDRGAWEKLTPREQEIMQQLAQGFEAKQIAAALGTAHHTVKTQIRTIYGKLAVNSRSEAVSCVFPSQPPFASIVRTGSGKPAA